MARIKRFYRAVWQRTPSGTWDRVGLGKQIAGPPPRDYNPEFLNHRDDKLEAIIGESVDNQGRAILLAKWKGFPVSEATWELEWRFTIEELFIWDTEMRELDDIECSVDGKPKEMKEGRDLLAICSIQRDILVELSEPIMFQPIKQMQEWYAAKRQNPDSVVEGTIRRTAQGQQYTMKDEAAYESDADDEATLDESEKENDDGDVDAEQQQYSTRADTSHPVSSPSMQKAAHILLKLKASDSAEINDECLRKMIFSNKDPMVGP